jgi:hypothetical protein
MPEQKKTQQELITSLSSALREVKPLLRGERIPEDNANEKIALWTRWVNESNE